VEQSTWERMKLNEIYQDSEYFEEIEMRQTVFIADPGRERLAAILMVVLSFLLFTALTSECVKCGNVKKLSGLTNQLIRPKNLRSTSQDTLASLIFKLRQTHEKAARHEIVDEMKRVCLELYGPPPDRRLWAGKTKNKPNGKSHLRQATNVSLQGSGPGIVHHVPFASTRNQIELTVDADQTTLLAGAKAAAVAMPVWIRIAANAQKMQDVNANTKERTFSFDFSVDMTAPVNKETEVTFAITSQGGDSWMKKITIVVDPPDRFELFQNFPNPFNPTTSITYLLPKQSFVILKVYNILGQEVETLVNGLQDAGYRTATLDARNLTSGVYFCRMRAESFSDIKRMIVIK